MPPERPTDALLIEWEDATRQAYDALSRYKFWMFGYHAARVVYIASLINRFGGVRLGNPFQPLVQVARTAYCDACGELKRQEHRCTSESLAWERQGSFVVAELEGARAAIEGDES